MTRRLSAAAARQVVEAAELVKAPDWRETNQWHVVAGGQVLVIVEPAYSGGRRNGWTWWLADGGRMPHPAQSTRQAAAVTGLDAWERWATRRPTR